MYGIARKVIQCIYSSQDLKWDTPEGRISNLHWNLTLAEIKCPILFLQGYCNWFGKGYI
jgi:hypothetical protein